MFRVEGGGHIEAGQTYQITSETMGGCAAYRGRVDRDYWMAYNRAVQGWVVSFYPESSKTHSGDHVYVCLSDSVTPPEGEWALGGAGLKPAPTVVRLVGRPNTSMTGVGG